MDFIDRLKQRLPSHRLSGRYKVLRELGIGGFSRTFLAEDTQLPGKPYCVVKQLKPHGKNSERWEVAKRLFDTEAAVLYQLGEHDQIPRLLAHFEDNQDFYLVQEFVDGEPLSKKLIPGQPWSEARVMVVLQDILKILAFVHARQVIHRDIKPSNLICRRADGRLALIDFGAVKQVSTPLMQVTDQTTTIAIGTHGYMPSEQIIGNPRFNSDLYALGIIGIQALTGIKPNRFKHDQHTGEIIWCEQPHEPLGATNLPIHPTFVKLLDRMVCYHFKERFLTVEEPLEILENLIQQQGIDVEAELEALKASTGEENGCPELSEGILLREAHRPPVTAVSPTAYLTGSRLAPAKNAVAVGTQPSTQLTVQTQWRRFLAGLPALEWPQLPPLSTLTKTITALRSPLFSRLSGPQDPAQLVGHPPTQLTVQTQWQRLLARLLPALHWFKLPTLPSPRSKTAALLPPAPEQKASPRPLSWHIRLSRKGWVLISSLPQTTLRQAQWAALISIGGAISLTVVIFATAFDARHQSAQIGSSLPISPCREPSPPALPSREADYVYPNGARYYGPLKDDLPADGKGTMVFPSGNRYDGDFVGGQRSGCGTYTFTNGRRYIGQFKNDRFEGQGEWVFENGARYVGSFYNNRCHGKGILFLPDGSANFGIWRDGKLLNSDISCDR